MIQMQDFSVRIHPKIIVVMVRNHSNVLVNTPRCLWDTLGQRELNNGRGHYGRFTAAAVSPAHTSSAQFALWHELNLMGVSNSPQSHRVYCHSSFASHHLMTSQIGFRLSAVTLGKRRSALTSFLNLAVQGHRNITCRFSFETIFGLN